MKLLLSPRISEDSKILWNEAPKHGWEVERIGWRVEEQNGPVALYGEIHWAHVVSEQLGLRLIDPPPDWLSKLSHDLLKRRVRFAESSYAFGPIELPAFIKPADDKCFGARVYHSLDGAEIHSGPILVSDPVTFVAEWRAWVLDGVSQAVGFYRGDKQHDSDIARVKVGFYASAACLETETPKAVVIDVGLLDTGSFAIIEANPAYASGIYDAPAAGVLRVLERATG